MAKTIAITGKGGVGKTTVAALVIRHLREHGQGAVLALDADPDCNLARVLGMDVETTIGDLREEILQQMKDWPAGMSKDVYVQAGLHQIIVETPKVDLITMGRSEGPGCYCFLNNLLRKFAEELLGSYEWLVMDNEAGMEHLSRRTASRVDHLIVVVNDGPLSIDSARRIDRLVGDMDRHVLARHVVLNAVAPDRQAGVLERLADTHLTYLGAIPHDEAVEEALFRGEAIYALQDTPAVRTMDQIMQRIGAG